MAGGVMNEAQNGNGHSQNTQHNGDLKHEYSLEKLFGCQGTVVITGGNGCIGLEMVKGLAAAGADIISIQIDDDDAVIRAANSYGRRGATYKIDLMNEEAVASIFGRILEDGWEPTCFIACAGIQRRGTVLDFDRKWLEDIMTVNCTSQFVLARDFARYRASRAKLDPSLAANTPFGGSNGKIIFLASNSSYSGGIEISGYTASKSAVLGMIRAFSNELAPLNIQVNGVAPGYVETTFTAAISSNKAFYDNTVGRIPAGRWGKPEDMVAAAIYLASRASNYTTGQTIIVDGGILVR